MKFLIEINIPTETGNKLLKNGLIIAQLHEYLKEVKPDHTYFSIKNGKRTVFMILNVESAEKFPEIAEPLWLDWNAEVNVWPIMDEKDFEKAGPGIQRVVEKRK